MRWADYCDGLAPVPAGLLEFSGESDDAKAFATFVSNGRAFFYDRLDCNTAFDAIVPAIKVSLPRVRLQEPSGGISLALHLLCRVGWRSWTVVR